MLEIDAMNLAAAESLQTLFQSTERYADMSLILQRKAEILEDLDDQKAALYQAAGIEEEVLERKEAAIGVYLKVLEIDAEDLRSIDALINLYLGLSRWEDLLGVYTKKADLVIDSDEKKLIFYQVGAVYERELSRRAARHRHLPEGARARSRRPDRARSPRRALPDRRELAGAAQRASTRGRADAGSRRSGQLPVPDRGALREAPRATSNARSSSTATSSTSRPTTSRR